MFLFHEQHSELEIYSHYFIFSVVSILLIALIKHTYFVFEHWRSYHNSIVEFFFQGS